MKLLNNLLCVLKSICWLGLLSFQVISYGSYTILVHLCEENGRITFSSTALNLTIEFFKLIFSCICLLFSYLYQEIKLNTDANKKRCSMKSKDIENGGFFKQTSKNFSFINSLNFAVPAILYFINNNLAVYIQLYMDSTSYQMLSNLKIFSTAVLYYLIMKKKINRVKWFSLCLLFFGGIFYTFGNLKSLANYYIDEKDIEFLIKPDNRRSNNEIMGRLAVEKADEVLKLTPAMPRVKFRLRDQIYITEIGFLLMVIYCLISGLSGVYNEYLLKLNFSDSIYIQNIYLYFYGCIFNLTAYLFESGLNDATRIYENSDEYLNKIWILSDFLYGFSSYTWLIIFTQVFNGFTMSIVMKHSNNLTRLFVISCSLVVTTFLSILIFSLKLNFYFYLSFTTIMMSLYLYVFN